MSLNDWVHSRFKRNVFVPLTVLFVVACSGSDNSESEQVSADDGLDDGAIEEIEGMAVSEGQQPLSPDEFVVIHLAEDRLIADCMADAGFDYPVRSASAFSVASAPSLLSPTELRQSGYQFDWEAAADSYLEINGPDGPPDPTAGMSDAEVEAYSEALRGSDPDAWVQLDDVEGGWTRAPSEGCGAEAQVELYGTVANAMRFDRAQEELHANSVESSLREDDEYFDAVTGWQECMEVEGFEVGDSSYGLSALQREGAVVLDEEGSLGSEAGDDLFVAVADADADCQESSGLYELRSELLPEAEEEAASRLGFELSQYVAFQNAVLEQAQDVE